MRRGFNRITRSSLDHAAIDAIFNTFCEQDEHKIGPEGMQALFERLNVDPLDISALIFAWKLQAKVPFEFSRAEFINGCVKLNADSVDKLKKVIRKFVYSTLLTHLSFSNTFLTSLFSHS